MAFTVEVRLIGSDLMTSMNHMRTWLDHQRVEPEAFRHSSGGAGITFRVDFKLESTAIAFAHALGGRLIGLPTAACGEASLWPSRAAPEESAVARMGLEPAVLLAERRN